MQSSSSGDQTHHEFLVIGSGPSGMAAASALLDAGRTVTVLDIADDLSATARQRVENLAQQEPPAWPPAERSWMEGALDVRTVPLKSLFGETFMYDRDREAPPGFDQWPSRALGGLSRVWGATLKRFDKSALAHWPVSAADMAPHDLAAETLLGVIGAPMSDQATELLQGWHSRIRALNDLGACVAPSTLAVSPDCKRCGMCLTGCPYGYIFSTDRLVERYRQRPGFRFLAGFTARRIIEREDHIELIAETREGAMHTYTADRVLVAAGPLATARLMLASFGGPDEAVVLRDSQYFLLPFLSPRPGSSEQAHVLSQIFLEFLQDGEPIHVQVYGHNAFYGSAIAARLGPFAGAARSLASWLGRHLVVAQGYLPSALSGTARLSVVNGMLQIDPRLSPQTRPALRRAGGTLARIGRLAHLYTLPALLEQTGIGRGYHSGATMPMVRDPSGWQSDLLGRVRGNKRVHVVDASVWTDIPSGPVTLTAMANAHRIATLTSGLDTQ